MAEAKDSSTWQLEKFGAQLVTKNGTVATSDVLNDAEVVALYFSAHWCPPCRAFTPEFAKVYKELKASGKKFECVFVSSDSDSKSAAGYYAEQPWTMLPFDDRNRKAALSDAYGVRGIPCLILLDGQSGEIITKEGRGPISAYGAAAYPFSSEAIEAAKKKAKEAKLAELVKLKPLLMGTVAGAAALASKPEHIALWYSRKGDRGSEAVQPKIEAVTKALGGKLSVLYVPGGSGAAGEEWAKRNAAAGIGCITMEEMQANGTALKTAFDSIFSFQAPHVALISGAADSIVSEDCVRELYGSGAKGYPWTEERMAELKAEADAMAASIKEAVASGGGMGFLGDKLLTKTGEVDAATVLNNADLVACYFSAHWCPPCRRFTPELAGVYKDLKAANKKFELVFVSSDRDQASFDEYYGEMPWNAMPFSERDRKEALSSACGVEGIPMLVIFDGKTGKILTTNGRDLVSQGAAGYPWGLASL